MHAYEGTEIITTFKSFIFRVTVDSTIKLFTAVIVAVS
jgi:hypothetical protein